MNSSFQPTGSLTVAPVFPLLSVLVVDDSTAIRTFMCSKIQTLASGSYEVDLLTATSGEEALDRCASQAFDVIFMDVVMPGMGGIEACRRIKAQFQARVAMVSSLKGQEDFDSARSAGCDNYLVKPVQDADIRAVLRIVSLRKQINR